MAIQRAVHGYETAAGDYDRARPEYPDEAGRWLAERLDLRPGRTVLDLAAGTGKLTRLLTRTGARVIAVEPVAGMRARLTLALPAVEVHDGTAEAIPLADGEVDAVTVGQAFHWFDGDRALGEAHRVTHAGTRLAVAFNRRPLEHAVHAELEAVLRRHRSDKSSQRSGRWRDAFARSRLWAPVEEVQIAHTQLLDREGLVARVASTSFIAVLPDRRRAEVLDEVRARVARRPEPIELPYVCEVFLWRRMP